MFMRQILFNIFLHPFEVQKQPQREWNYESVCALVVAAVVVVNYVSLFFLFGFRSCFF